MRPGRRAATLAACLALHCGAVQACTLLLQEQRSGLPLLRLPLDAQAPDLRIAFVHSVLGTPVVDHYRFTPQARLVSETFEGDGYGLPNAAGPGETLERHGRGWQLRLDRLVHPLVVRPLRAQRMRLLLPDGDLLLADLSAHAIEFLALGCAGIATGTALHPGPSP